MFYLFNVRTKPEGDVLFNVLITFTLLFAIITRVYSCLVILMYVCTYSVQSLCYKDGNLHLLWDYINVTMDQVVN